MDETVLIVHEGSDAMDNGRDIRAYTIEPISLAGAREGSARAASGPAPDYASPVSGWRTWRVDDSGAEARLRSVVRSTAWPVGEAMIAECPSGNVAHRPPGPGCRCGIHAARDVAGAAMHAEIPSREREPLAVGLAALWGRVVEGTRGWRASAAYPEALYLPMRRRADRGLCERLAWDLSAYGATIEIVDCTEMDLARALRAVTARTGAPLPQPIAA